MSREESGTDAAQEAATAGAPDDQSHLNCPGCGWPGKRSDAQDHHMRCKTAGCNVWKYFSFRPWCEVADRQARSAVAPDPRQESKE